ncbi:MAG: C-type lectin domain-containing protein [Planctomycetota bacterium]|jgi:hypothetical protein
MTKRIGAAAVLLATVGVLAPTALGETSADFRAAREAIWSRALADCYQDRGSRDELWDSRATAFLKTLAVYFAADEWDQPFPDDWDDLLDTGRLAIAAGCDDPIVWMGYGIALHAQGQTGEALPFLRDALHHGEFLPADRLLLAACAARLSQVMTAFDEPDLAERYADRAGELFLRIVGDPTYDATQQRGLLAIVDAEWLADRTPPELKTFLDAAAKLDDADLWTLKMLAGRYYVAMLRGLAEGTVQPGPDSYSYPRQLTEKAQAFLLGAQKEHSDWPEPLVDMLRMGNYSDEYRWQMAEYFRAAISTQPDCHQAYAAFIEVLPHVRPDEASDMLRGMAEQLSKQPMERFRHSPATPLLYFNAMVTIAQTNRRPPREILRVEATAKALSNTLKSYDLESVSPRVATAVRLVGAANAFACSNWAEGRQWLDGIDNLPAALPMAEGYFRPLGTSTDVAIGRIFAETSNSAEALKTARQMFRDEKYDQAASVLTDAARLAHDNPWVMAYLRHAARHILVTRDLKAGKWVNIMPDPQMSDWWVGRGQAWVDHAGRLVGYPVGGEGLGIICRKSFGQPLAMRGRVEFPDAAKDASYNAGPIFAYLGWYRPWHILAMLRNGGQVSIRQRQANQGGNVAMPIGQTNTFNLQIAENRLSAYVNGKLVQHDQLEEKLPLWSGSLIGVGCGSTNPPEDAACHFTDLQVRKIKDMPAKGTRDTTTPTAEPIRISFGGYDAPGQTERLGDVGPLDPATTEAFEHVLQGPGWLAGLRVGLGSARRGRGDVVARPGYAVAKIEPAGKGEVRALRIVFMRVRTNHTLDTHDQYTSRWVGPAPASDKGTTIGNGQMVVGLFGRVDPAITAMGLIATDQPNLAGITITPPASLLPARTITPQIAPAIEGVTELGGRYYAYVNLPVSWAQAERHCDAMGGRLARIDSRAVNNFLVRLAERRPCWIGLRRGSERPQWTWPKGDAPTTTFWADDPKQTQSGGDVAAIGHAGQAKWAARSGVEWMGFICQWDEDPRDDGDAAPGSDVQFTDNGLIYNGHRYEVFDEPVTWPIARALCREKGGRLVVIDSAEENAVVSLLVGDRPCFIGATDIDAEGRWGWDGGAAVDAAHWGAGQPNNAAGRQHVAAFNPRLGADKWDDVAANERHAFICEWDAADPATAGEVAATGPKPVDDAVAFKGRWDTPRWYKAYYDAVTWAEAQRRCKQLGGQLARIDSTEENAALLLLTRKDHPLWIGATRNETDWHWTNGDTLTYTNWAAGGTKDAEQNRAAAIRFKAKGKWLKASADERYGFICQWDDNPAGERTSDSPDAQPDDATSE